MLSKLICCVQLVRKALRTLVFKCIHMHYVLSLISCQLIDSSPDLEHKDV